MALSDTGHGSRRDFLRNSGRLSAALASAPLAAGAASEATLPQIKLGRHSISRLICGANTFNAGSHLSTFVNQELRRWFTPEQRVKMLLRCQEVGINCWQSTVGDLAIHRRFLDAGGKMNFLAIDDGKPETLERLVQGGCIGIAHHGEFTDRMFKQGALGQLRDLLKRFRDTGVPVGVSTHMPAVVDTIESQGWDIDYYMTCVYERHRTAAELKQLLGYVPIPVGEVYLTEDPPRMFKMVQQTKKPCLAFKILAAGRLSERAEFVERAFRETFAAIKPADGVIVGMWDKFSDQPQQNAEFVRRFGSGLPSAG